LERPRPGIASMLPGEKKLTDPRKFGKPGRAKRKGFRIGGGSAWEKGS